MRRLLSACWLQPGPSLPDVQQHRGHLYISKLVELSQTTSVQGRFLQCKFRAAEQHAPLNSL
jgi:hypothetical protein